MTQNQISVLKWWYGTRNYQDGIMLFSLFSKNKVLISSLSKSGKENFGGKAKLDYELPKSVGLNYLDMPPLPDDADQPVQEGNDKLVGNNNPNTSQFPQDLKIVKSPSPHDSDNTENANDVNNTNGAASNIQNANNSNDPAGEDILHYPKIIRRLKYEYSSLYSKRSVLHKQMRDIPENNTEENKTSRAILLEQIKEYSAELDRLYPFIKDYEDNNIVPDEKIVFPPKVDDNPETDNDDCESLKKIKKNLQTSNAKDRNLLLYQEKKKLQKQNPMPAGPLRTKIQKRIDKRTSRIKTIEFKLLSLENAD